MTARPQDLCDMREHLHRMRLLRSNIDTRRPAVAAADNWIDDTIASLDSAIDFYENAERIVARELRHSDERASGDRNADGSGRAWPRYP